MFEDEVYYKIYYHNTKTHITIVCMQWFDENGYIAKNFLKDEDGEDLKFTKEAEAIRWLNNNVTDDVIDPEYRRFKQESVMKEYKTKRRG